MQRYIHIIIFACLITLSTSCAVIPPYDPFIKSRSEIFNTVDVLSMTPVILSDFDRKDEVAARYEALITERLETAGFKVIPSSEYSSIRDPMVEQLGGMFDPATGQADKEKLAAVRLHTTNELVAKFDIDGYVRPRIMVVKASWNGNTATWDGVTDHTTGKGGFWADLFGPQATGTIPALSLILPLTGTSGETYYVGRGGIQLFAHYKGGFVDVPESMLFVDPEKDVNAVNVALASLLIEPVAQ
jgi:hypothetical protein